MLDTLHASPSVGSYSAEPFDINEIDAHPDRDRIWATVTALVAAADAEISDAEIDVEKVEDIAADEQLLADKDALSLWAKKTDMDFIARFPNQRSLTAVKWLCAQIADVRSAL